MPPAVLPYALTLIALTVACVPLLGISPLIIGFGLQFLARQALPGWIAPVAGTGCMGLFWLAYGFLPTRIGGDELPWLSTIVSASVMTILFKWGAGLCRCMFARRFNVGGPAA